MNLTQYKTLVLDCDGVVLNSNKTKVNAYFEVAKRHGATDEQAQALVNHHVQKGSFPRNGKIDYYLKEIRKQEVTPELMQAYMHTFDEILDRTLMECEIAAGLHALRQATQHSKWMLLPAVTSVNCVPFSPDEIWHHYLMQASLVVQIPKTLCWHEKLPMAIYSFRHCLLAIVNMILKLRAVQVWTLYF